MKHIIKIYKVLFIVLFTLFTPFSTVYAATTEEIYQIVSSDIEAANNYVEQIDAMGNDPEGILAVIQREAPNLENQFYNSAIFYSNAASATDDEELKAILKRLEENVKGLSTSLKTMELAMVDEDPDSFETAANNYDAYMDNFNLAIKDLDSHNGAYDYEPILTFLFWISLIISLVLFIMSRGKETLPAEKLRNEFEFALFKSSLWQFGASAISYFWFLLTPPGGSFYFLWGIIAVGYFQFFRGIYSYIKEARPAIEKAKKLQQAKLDDLLTSDEFKNASYQEKIDEISNRKPIIEIGSSHKKCPHCHKENTKEANFCKECGKKI